MHHDPTKYAGIAAAFVFGIGLLLIGKVAVGIGVLGMGIYVLAITFSSDLPTKALLTSVMAVVWSAVLAYNATENEITGNAIYRHGFGRGSRAEPVTRIDSPDKFREATNLVWGWSVVCCLVSMGAFMFYRNCRDADAESFY